MDLCDECLTLCFKFLTPKERISFFVLSPLLHETMQNSENKSLWNDMRLLFKYADNATAPPFTLKLIHSPSSYPKPFANCVLIEINKECKEATSELSDLWIWQCISNIETFGNN